MPEVKMRDSKKFCMHNYNVQSKLVYNEVCIQIHIIKK
jgi:hypothetical protein